MAKVLNQDQGDLRERWQMPCRLSQWKGQRRPVYAKPSKETDIYWRDEGIRKGQLSLAGGEGTDLTSGLPSGKGHCASKSVLNL